MAEMRVTKPPENRRDKIAELTDRGPLGIPELLVGGVAAIVFLITTGFAIWGNGPWLAPVITGAISVVSLSALFWGLNHTWGREVTGGPYDAMQSLSALTDTYKNLPVDMRRVARPVLDGAFVAVTLPKGALKAVQIRLTLMREFAVEAEAQKLARVQAKLDNNDVDAAQAALRAMQDVRKLGQIEAPSGSDRPEGDRP